MALLYSTPISLYADALDAEIERLFSVGIIPEDFLSGLLDKVGIIDVATGYDSEAEAWSFTGSFEVDGEISLALPGLDFFKVIIGADPESSSNNFILNLMLRYQDGVLSVSILDIDVILEVTGGGFFKSLENDSLGTYSLDSITYRASDTLPIRFYTERGFEFHFDTSGVISISEPEAWSFSPFCIPALGIGFNIQNMILRLSTGNDMPVTLTGLGYDSDWVGFYAESFDLVFESDSFLGKIIDDLNIDDLAIGKGGFSGKISAGPWLPVLNTDGDGFDAGYGVTDIFGIPLAVESVAVEFKENSFVESSVAAQMILPFFSVPLEVGIGFTNDGDFAVSIAAEGGLELTIPDVLNVGVESIEFAKEEDEFLITISGWITPLIGGLDWPTFELKGLKISSSGKVQVEGGWIELPDMKALDFNGFSIEIAKLGFGTEEIDGTSYRWIGFSGGIQIISGVPLEGGVEGLRLLWNPADSTDFKLQLSGVSVGFEIPNVLDFKGHAKWIEELNDSGEEIKGFSGGVDVTIPPLNGLSLEAQFLAAKNLTKDFKYFYIYLGVNLPAGIPVVPPALGLYGLKGLFGYNVSVDKSPSDEWYVDYYKKSPEGITHPDKWKDDEGAMAMGAGVTLRTLPDTGFSLTTEVLLVVLIPGPVIVLEGKATLVSREPGDPYPFKILVVLDAESGTFLANVELTYLFPKNSGALLEVSGMAEVFFNFNDPGDWHLYLGQDEPESKQIRAEILSFFKASTYFMLDPDKFKMGVWIGYDFEKKYGPLKVALQAWFDGKLTLSFSPIQSKGSITLFGNVELSAFGIGVGLTVEASVEVEAPKPLGIEAKVKVTLKTPVGNPSATVKLKWEKAGDPGYPVLLEGAGSFHPKVTENADLGKAVTYSTDDDGIWNKGGTGSDGLSWSDRPEIPSDTQIVLSFSKPVKDETGLGMADFGEPEEEKVGNYNYKYSLTNLSLEEADSSSGPWTNADDRLFGAWQMQEGSDGLMNVQLSIGASTPFEKSELLADNQSWLYLMGLTQGEYPCEPAAEEVWLCTDFQAYDLGTEFYPFLFQDGYIFFSRKPMEVIGCNENFPDLFGRQALRTEAADPVLTCIDIAGQAPGVFSTPFTIDDVLFIPGSEHPLELRSLKGATLIYDQDSNDVGQTPINIEFPLAIFQQQPLTVELKIWFLDNTTGIFTFFDQNGNLLGSVTLVDDGNHDLHTISFTDTTQAGIARIEVRSAIMYIKDICYTLEQLLEPEIKVSFPEPAVEAKVTFCTGAFGEILVYDVDAELRQTIALSSADPIGMIHIDMAQYPGSAILIKGQFSLHEVCTLTQEAKEAAQFSNSAKIKNETMLEEFWDKSSADILAPGKFYKLEVTTQGERKKKSGSSWETPVEFVEYIYFKTGSVPGTAAGITDAGLDPDKQESYPIGGPLIDLNAYILSSIPTQSGAGEPQWLAYRSYDLGVQFNESYVPQWYAMEDFDLKIRVYDNNGDPLLNDLGEIISLTNLWETYSYQVLTEAKTIYTTLMEDCSGFSVVDPSESEVELSEVIRILLKPGIQYRAVLVAEDETNAHEVYTYNFTTSAYANFRQHLHSFAQAAWDHFALQDDAGFTLVGADLDGILASGLEEEMVLEQLMEFFAMPASRALPQQVEITALSDSVKTYGLLLESPEPLDWDRIDLNWSQGGLVEAIEVDEGPLRIITAQTATTTDPNEQWIDLLFQEGKDVSGYSIETCNRAKAEVGPWETIYTFGEDVNYAEGTVLRIFAGTDPGTGDESEDDHLYGGLADRPFKHPREIIRIKNAVGKIEYTRLFFRDTFYSDKNVRMVVNGDGTRAFLFKESGGADWTALSSGQNRLKMTYNRDVGTDSPKQMRYGFSDSEVVQLDFSLPAGLPD